VRAKARCLGCGQVAILSRSRCDTCRRTKRNTRYPNTWPTQSRDAIATHVATHGHVCPGYHQDPHPSTDLTLDHEVGVLCRACNTRKRNTGHG
jgi:hypothetical protein